MGLPSLSSGEYNRPHSTEEKNLASISDAVAGTSLTKHFTTAAAAAAQPRQKRYAAHIPITGSGKNERQSATSIVSNNNGVLETATYEVDQMIDQAQYRHYQHRSKFKEAIDYLDQIFEDLQKESDQTSKDSQQSRVVPAVPLRKGIASCSKKQQDTSVVQVKLRPHNSTNRSVETMVGLERKVPREMHVSSTNRHSLQGAKTTLSEKCCRHEKSASFEQVAEDVDAQETIVLRPPDRKLKGERMDFTRRWLTGDIKSWASVQPKVDLSLGGLEEEPDVDERSLGSCSAEVAAINSANRKKKARDIPDLIQDVASTAKYVRCKKTNHLGSIVPKKIGFHYSEQSGPLKPQPVKAGALYPLPSSSSRSANSFPQPFRDENLWASAFDNINGNCCLLQKVSSYDRIPKKKQSSEDTLCWGPTSQDPNNALNSIRSTEIPHSIQKTGAFTPVQSSNVVTMYGSVASLSDSSVIRPQLLHSADPVLAINALVAELELNTDQTTVVDKRRSFPTGNEFPVYHDDRDHEQPTSDRQALHNDAQSIFKTTKLEQTSSHQQRNRFQKPKKFFDDIPSMLQHVSSSVVPKGPRKIRKSEQKGVSVLSAFETINHEKLNPSKVEALQSMFENKQHAPVWRRNVPSSNHISNNNTNKHNCGAQLAAVKDDDNYHEISDFGGLQKESSPICTKPLGKQLSPAHLNDQQQRQISSSQHEFIPAFPVSQPPSHPPGSTNSSQTGGYYSSGSSLGVPSYASHNNQSSLPRSVGYRGSLVEKHSASSRAVSFEDEDDGFYDNIQIEEKRFSHGSELDDMSIGSHRLPPVVTACKPTTNRLGKFLRKISASKPPGSAASLISLNQVASEVVTDAPIPLLKSSSLSHDPWKKQLVENVDNFMQRADVVDKRSGLGQRLKNSIFGSKKRLN